MPSNAARKRSKEHRIDDAEKRRVGSYAERALNGLPWDLNNRPEWAGLKQRAVEAAATAIGKLSADATSRDMEEIARLAVEPLPGGLAKA